MHDEILESGHKVIGVSPQGKSSHQRFRDQYNLPFPLITDTRRDLIRKFGVAGPLGFGVRRATFLIGTDGVISERHVSDFGIASHGDFVRNKTQE